MTDVLGTVVQASRMKNENKDCAVRAIAIAADYEYDDVHYVFQLCGRRNRRGTPNHITEKVCEMLRFRMVDVTECYTARTVRTLEREVRKRWRHKDRLIVWVNGHLLPLVNGKVHDWTRGRLHRIKKIFKLEETDPKWHERNNDESHAGR